MKINKYLNISSKNSIGVKKWNSQQQTKFFQLISELLRMGFSIQSALTFLMNTEKDLLSGIAYILEELKDGKSLVNGLYPLVNSETYYQLMISEQHGELINSFEQISKFNKIKLKQIKKIHDLMLYPIFLILLLILLMVGINLFIKPQLDLITNTKNPQINYFNIVALGLIILALLGALFGYYKKYASVIQKIEFLIKIPIIGKITKYYLSYYIANTLAILLKNGLSLKEINFLFKSFPRDSLLYYLNFEIENMLIEGTSLEKFSRQYSFISKDLFKLLAIGNKVDDLANNMFAYANLMFKKMIKITNRLISIVQPTMFLIIGITIILTYFQLLMPLYNSMKGI